MSIKEIGEQYRVWRDKRIGKDTHYLKQKLGGEISSGGGGGEEGRIKVNLSEKITLNNLL